MTTTPPAVRLNAIDLDLVPPGSIGRQMVQLVEDSLGRPIRVPVMIARGRRDGPVFGLTAALHGNELNGIPVLHRLFRRVDVEKLRGTVVGVPIVNVPGLVQNQREFIDGADLNHLFPGSPDGNVSQLYAARFVDRVLQRFDYLVDLHTASFGRVNSLYVRADLSDPDTRRIARLLRPEIVLHNPASDGTLRGTAMAMGIPAVTLEIGNPQRFQERFINASVVGIRSVLGEFGLLPKRKVALGLDPVACSGSEWLYTSKGGLLRVLPEVTDRISAGDVVAKLTTIFGDLAEEYVAPRDGIVIGKSVNPVGQAGARILHLGTVEESRDAVEIEAPASS